MSKEAMKLALETLEVWKGYMPALWDKTDEQAIIALQEALAEQPAQQEPVAWMVWGENNVPSLTFTKPSDKYVFDSLCMTPPQRTWVWLTEQEAAECWSTSTVRTWQAIEAKLKEKNGL